MLVGLILMVICSNVNLSVPDHNLYVLPESYVIA